MAPILDIKMTWDIQMIWQQAGMRKTKGLYGMQVRVPA